MVGARSGECCCGRFFLSGGGLVFGETKQQPISPWRIRMLELGPEAESIIKALVRHK
jgi:hypothetical protein